jgi:hypothetical protein
MLPREPLRDPTAPVRIGAVGLGYWGPNLARMWGDLEDCRLAWLCDLDEGLLDRTGRQLPQARRTTCLDEVLSDPEVDAVSIATSAQAMSPAPLHQPDGMITQVREACGVGRVRVNGICVARTTRRHLRREARRVRREARRNIRHHTPRSSTIHPRTPAPAGY